MPALPVHGPRARLIALGLCIALSLAVSPAVEAARPFNTDDARIVDPGGYQIESYVKDQRRTSETEFWFLPAANFGGALDRMEWTLGGNVVRSDPNGDSDLVQAQVKTLLKALPDNGFGFAVTVGVARVNPGSPVAHVPTDEGPIDVPSGAASTKVRYNPYVNLISSLSVADGDFVFHANGGAQRETREGFTIKSWGLGVEMFARARAFPIFEAYGVSGEKPAKQLGVRIWAIPNRFQIDGTVGWQSNEPKDLRWVSIGLRLLW